MTDAILFLIFQVILRKSTTHFSLTNLKRWNNLLSMNNSKKHMTIKAFELWDSWGAQNQYGFSLMTSEPHMCAITVDCVILNNPGVTWEVSIFWLNRLVWNQHPIVKSRTMYGMLAEAFAVIWKKHGFHFSWPQDIRLPFEFGHQVILKSLQNTHRKWQVPEGEDGLDFTTFVAGSCESNGRSLWLVVTGPRYFHKSG